VLEGLPISQYRELEVTIGPNSNDTKPVDKDAWPELPMPRDSHLLPLHSQQLLRAARSGRTIKPPAPVEDDDVIKEEEEEIKEVPVGFTVKKFVKIARHLELPEPEYLAKRRKGLPSQYVNSQAAPALRETIVKKLDAEGNVAIYKVLVPEGQAVEGEIQSTDDAVEAVSATAAPGTVVEGIGVVNAEGIVVANDVKHQTPPRRRAPPPKRKRGGPGRGRRRVTFAGREDENGTPNPGGDLVSASGLRREDGSVAPSDGGDTPMADAGGDEDEGSGEEGSEDEDQDMGQNSTPATPSRVPLAPSTSALALNDSAMPDTNPAEPLPTAASPVHAKAETPELPAASEPPAPSKAVTEITETRVAPDLAHSSDLPLSRSRQNSPTKMPTSLPKTDATAPELTTSDTTTSSTVPSESTPAPVTAPASVVPGGPAIQPDVEVAERAGSAPTAPPSEPDLLGSLERQLEQDSKDLAG